MFRWTKSTITAVLGLSLAAPAHAQDGGLLGVIFRAGASGLSQNAEQRSSQKREAAEAIQTMAQDPDAFCRLSVHASVPTPDGFRTSSISGGVARFYEGTELLTEARRIATESKESARGLIEARGGSTAIERMHEEGRNLPSIREMAEEKQRRRAEVLGQSYAAPQKLPAVTLDNTAAVTFNQQTSTLHCQSEATVDQALWIKVTWQVGFGKASAEAYHAGSGWYVQHVDVPEQSLDYALAHQDAVMVTLSNRQRLPLSAARNKVQTETRNLARIEADKRAEEQSKTAYANSAAGRADAARQSAQKAANDRALSTEYRRLGLACQNNGGTWGIRWNNNTIMAITPGVVPGELARFSLGCYRL